MFTTTKRAKPFYKAALTPLGYELIWKSKVGPASVSAESRTSGYGAENKSSPAFIWRSAARIEGMSRDYDNPPCYDDFPSLIDRNAALFPAAGQRAASAGKGFRAACIGFDSGVVGSIAAPIGANPPVSVGRQHMVAKAVVAG